MIRPGPATTREAALQLWAAAAALSTAYETELRLARAGYPDLMQGRGVSETEAQETLDYYAPDVAAACRTQALKLHRGVAMDWAEGQRPTGQLPE